MNILKKFLYDFKNYAFVMVFIDLIFVLSVFFTFYFAVRIIQDRVLMIYSLGDRLQEISQLLEENSASLMDVTSTLEILNQASNYIIFTTIAAFATFFLLWCFFKSLVWKYAHDHQSHLFAGFGKYLLNFSMISIIMFLVMAPLFTVFFRGLRYFVIGSSMYTLNISVLLLFFILFLVVVFYILYLFSCVFVMLNKHNKIESLRKGLSKGVRRFFLYLSFLGIWVLVLLILYVDRLISGFGKVFMFIDLLIILVILAFYRVWFTRKVIDHQII